MLCLCAPAVVGGLASGAPRRESSTQAAADVSPVVDALYISQPLMLEMLINEDCAIDADGSTLTISSSPNNREGAMALSITVIPGIQNLAAAADLLRDEIPQEFSVDKMYDTREGELMGAQARFFGFVLEDETKGVAGAVIANQSLYLLLGLCAPEATTNEALLLDNLIASMSVIQPQRVDQQARTATYASKYKGYRLSPGYAGEDLNISSWSALPYGYYTSGSEPTAEQWSASELYEPDQNYYEDGGSFWSWAWDEACDWLFYDEYGDDCYGYDAYADCGTYSGGDACSIDVYLEDSGWQVASFRNNPDFYEYDDGIWYFYDDSDDFFYCYDEYEDAWYVYVEADDEWYYIDL